MSFGFKPYLLLLLGALCHASTVANQPNILLLFSDDAGYADFGFQGSPTHQTPHLDSIANTGVRFTRAYVSGPVCSPSRAGLLSGKYQQFFGHGNNLPNPHPMGLPLDIKLMPEYLQELGYGTYMIGKWHLGIPEPYQPQNRGFDRFFGILEGARSYHKIKNPSLGKALVENGQRFQEEAGLYVTDLFGDKAIEFLNDHFDQDPNKPFFMYLSFTAPHSPMDAKEEDIHALDHVEFESEERKINAAMTLAMDREVGRILELLKARGELDNTMVIFLNDNGGAGRSNHSSNLPLRGHKSSMFEGGVRVPMLVSWPSGGIPKGVDFDGVTSSFDLLPTFIRMAGGSLSPDWELEGRDLMPYLRGDRVGDPHATLAWRFNGYKGRKALLHRGWKYINWEGSESLFHIESDPCEKKNLAKQNPNKVDTMRTMLLAWEANAMQPLWWWNKDYERKYALPPEELSSLPIHLTDNVN
ncbi:sulfatase family protein [Rubellicoccus peritrichatus]|uniref:Sulfatase-like hydrolase/transferase n=1 Tax=Rubellicoccus peritrichatus TaxID=3080537 RepID=A0AAQ3LDW8_9BACT|nr:sulfatase-like hydrolase/transferase [Puniceicoccus sp. CR14]WOO43706.1 sulfatase-like hydrolase/transferase [Puniceicoccus sp. CR14]